MILDSLSGSGRKEKEREEVHHRLVESVKKKDVELENKDRQIQHLSKNIRKWTRKYHELELSVSNSVLEIYEPDEPDHIQEIKHLQKMILKLNRKNKKLEMHLNKISNAPREKDITPPVTPVKTTNSFSQGAEEEPEFSSEFKSVLEKYADACNH